MKKKVVVLSIVFARIFAVAIHAQENTSTTPSQADIFGFEPPAWMTDLSLGVTEGCDNNLLAVSGYGLRPESSAFTMISPRVGFNFAPLIGDQQILKTLSFSYTPDFSLYYNAPQENYEAHKFGNAIQGKAGDFSFGLDNAFLYNDGSSTAPTYAVSPANVNDDLRSFYATAMPRERRNQFQDRASAVLQYDVGKLFFRPTASLLYYDMKTDLRNAGPGSGNVGYQNYEDRYDVNGGADVGYQIASSIAITLGCRDGHQYQEQYPTTVSPTDRHYASSDYQRVLLGLEGKWNWLTYKLSGGPDFRSYNSMAPVNDFHPIKYYGEATISAKFNDRHSVTFNYKQWEWVSSTGYVPYFDSTFALNYHWKATKKLELELGGKILEADFTGGNENGLQVPSETSSLRDDRQYTILAGAGYAFTSRLNAGLSYSYDLGANVLGNLPPALSATDHFRDFSRQSATIGVQYKF